MGTCPQKLPSALFFERKIMSALGYHYYNSFIFPTEYLGSGFKHLKHKTGTVKPVNKGHPMDRQNMVFIDKWSLF